MLILSDEMRPMDRVAAFVWQTVEKERQATIIRLLGRLVAYLPRSRRSYYEWALVLTYYPAQYISYYQFSPSQLRILLFQRWEIGLVLSNWWLGLRLAEPLFWLKRLQPLGE